MTAETAAGYSVGHDEAELERLYLQGRLLAPATRTILEMAGLEPGMALLDLGSGAGDVSFLAAEIVGPRGRVLGIDASPDAVWRAIERAQEQKITNVRFTVGDIQRAAPDGPFDAIIGRVVLMYLSDPSTVLRTQATVLRPGGVVVPIEIDTDSARTVPLTPLAERLASWIVEVFDRFRIHTSLGPKLRSVLKDAGLHPQGMIGIQPCFGPDNHDGVALLAGIVHTLMPLMERADVATVDEIGPATLQDRLSTELFTARAIFAYPTLYGAWATVNPSL
jgi:SAM-dependent methyltransferase